MYVIIKGMKNKTLSIIITAHHEGEIIERAIKSLFVAAKRLKKIDIEYNFLVNVDKGDEETIKSLKKYENRKDFSIFRTEFGDPGLARNSIIKIATGEYVALMDADDMISENWLEVAMKRILVEHGEVLIHPEAELRFDRTKILSLNLRVDSKKDFWLNSLSLFGGNKWCSIVLGKKEIFLKNKYSESVHGFGYEDYYFNCITTGKKIRHLVAPQTTAFLLQKENSVTVKTHLDNDVLPYVNLFNLKKMKIKTKFFGLPKPFEYSRSYKVPVFVKEQAQKIKNIDVNIVNFLKKSFEVSVVQDGVFDDYWIGVTFCEMIKKTKFKNIKKILFLDNLVELNEVKYEKGALHVVVGAENISSGNKVLAFGKFFGWTAPIVKDLVLTRLVVQIYPQEIEMGETEAIKRWVREHEKYLTGNNIKVIIKKCR